MKKWILTLAVMLCPSLYAAHLNIQIQDVMDLATYSPVSNVQISIDEDKAETRFHFSIEKWSEFFHVKGYHIEVSGVIKKVFESENQYFVHMDKNLFFEKTLIKNLTKGNFLLTGNGKSALKTDSYWAPGLNLIVRQENVLKVVESGL
jgi:hypothetical protein